MEHLAAAALNCEEIMRIANQKEILVNSFAAAARVRAITEMLIAGEIKDTILCEEAI